ncbi:MAG: hypothetical protein RL120_01935 [Gammaproteobacteria bacterium]
MLRGLTEIITNVNRYWIHTLLVVTTVLFIIQTWWALWDFNVVASWTLPAFLLCLSVTMCLFVMAHVLVPTTRTADIDWQPYYEKVNRWYFTAFVVMASLGIGITYSLLGTPLLHPYRIFQASFMILSLIALAKNDRQAHGIIVVLILLVLLISQFSVRFAPGALATN